MVNIWTTPWIGRFENGKLIEQIGSPVSSKPLPVFKAEEVKWVIQKLFEGLDEYWVTLPENRVALEDAASILGVPLESLFKMHGYNKHGYDEI
jgi:hypothetical protein